MSVESLAISTSPTAGGERWLALARRARWLSWLSLGLITAEGAVAIVAGVLAGSVALIGFGIDSGIEGLASLVIVWRFTGWRLVSDAAEARAQRLVALQFFLLAPYVAFESVTALAGGERPDVSQLGIALAATSAVVMPMLGMAKQRIGRELGSTATQGEGAQNLLCAYLALALLVGLLGNALIGAWWLDPAVGMLIAAAALKAGRDTWRGQGCCALPAAAPPQRRSAAAASDSGREARLGDPGNVPPVARWDDDDWVGEPPEGRYSADRADPAFWRRNWPVSVTGVGLVLALVVLLLAWLL